MKSLQTRIFLFLLVSLLGCSNSSETVVFNLTNDNLAGTYNVSSLNKEEKQTATSAGTVVTISTAITTGDTFQVTFSIDKNGTYTSAGQYRIVTKTTPNGGATVEESKIINFSTTGSYTINNAKNTITFTANNEDFLEGEYTIETFNETILTISYTGVNVIGGITLSDKGTIGFVRQ